MSSIRLPLVGVICDKEILGPHPFHVAGDKYLQAIISASGCLPVLIPALAEPAYIKQLLATVDGILLTGGYSMVNPLSYQAQAASDDTKLDDARDNTSMPIAKAAVKMGIPLLGICRGFQEINVAFGGTLHQYLHQTGQYIEHRENKDIALEQQYAASHNIELVPNGKLRSLLGESNIMVNSLHTQGIDRLADGLFVEAKAEDGLVEAFSITQASTFAMAVQWHPEWQVQNNKNSIKLFHAFGQACSQKQLTREIHG
jgi:putative glutamine amidotransferase